MSLVFQTSKWANGLWRSHITHSLGAEQMVIQGKEKQPRFREFTDDIFSALYLRHAPEAIATPTPPAWATALLSNTAELPQWKALRHRCEANSFTAGIATEAILRAIMPQIPDRPPPPTPKPKSMAPPSQNGQTPTPLPDQGDDAQAMRKALREACTSATNAIGEAEEAIEGLEDALGIHQGHGLGDEQTLVDVSKLQELYALVKDNSALKDIARIAGRLQRLGHAHKKCLVTPAPGGIKDVVIGGDLMHILPGELAGLRATSKLLRLQTLNKIFSRQALQYLTEGIQSEIRGPIVVCCDESGSMRFSANGADLWSKAVAMALLSTATQQKRAWHMIGFSDEITHEQTVLPGELTLDHVLQTLLHVCNGGTDFNKPLTRALDVIEKFPAMKKADVIFITDGEAKIDEAVIERINTMKKETNLHLYVIAIGRAGKKNVPVFRPIASEIYMVSSTPEDESATIAPIIALSA